jgi:hypothetical protein
LSHFFRWLVDGLELLMIVLRVHAFSRVATLVAALFFGKYCFGEEAPSKSGTETAPSSEAKPRDPTQPSTRLKQALKSTEKQTPVAAPAPIARLPEIVLKGIVENNKGDAAAVLQIAGKELYTVRKGSEFSVTASDGSKATLIVKLISSEGVQIDVPAQNQTLNIR